MKKMIDVIKEAKERHKAFPQLGSEDQIIMHEISAWISDCFNEIEEPLTFSVLTKIAEMADAAFLKKE